jgi:DnaJ-class molecular chaperone
MSKDYYKILDVEKGASKEELKKAFRKKAHEYHPDKQTGNEAKFKEVNEAYQTLSDDQKRAQYDRFGSAGPQFGGQGGQGFGGFDFGGFNVNFDGFQNGQEFDLNDIFSAFGGGFGARVRKGRDIVLTLNLSFKEAILGVSKTIKVPANSAMKDKGDISVKIPAGIENGQMVKLAGYGEPIQDGQAGDILLRTYVESHASLRKEGIHLVTNLVVRLTDAILGATYDVEGIEGPIKIKIPKGIQTGKILRIKGAGVPAGRFQHGDLLVVIEVDIPDSLSREQKKLIEELQKSGL